MLLRLIRMICSSYRSIYKTHEFKIKLFYCPPPPRYLRMLFSFARRTYLRHLDFPVLFLCFFLAEDQLELRTCDSILNGLRSPFSESWNQIIIHIIGATYLFRIWCLPTLRDTGIGSGSRYLYKYPHSGRGSSSTRWYLHRNKHSYLVKIVRVSSQNELCASFKFKIFKIHFF